MGVGRGCGQMTWVKKKKKGFPKKIERQKVVKFMKRKSPRTCQFYSPSPRSAKQIVSESLVLVQTDTKIRNSVHYVNI